jgi:hypothetical protein
MYKFVGRSNWIDIQFIQPHVARNAGLFIESCTGTNIDMRNILTSNGQ